MAMSKAYDTVLSIPYRRYGMMKDERLLANLMNKSFGANQSVFHKMKFRRSDKLPETLVQSTSGKLANYQYSIGNIFPI